MSVSRPPRLLTRFVYLCENLSESVYQIFKFPARSRKVTLYINGEKKSQLTTEFVGHDDRCNTMLTELYLDKLGPSGQIFRFFGMLSTLYVVKAGP